MKKYIMYIFCFLAIQSQAQKELEMLYKADIEQHRAAYLSEFEATDNGPLKKEDFQYVTFFEPNMSYKVTANVVLTPDEKPFEMTTSSGKLKPYRKYAALHFHLEGNEMVLFVYQSLKLMNNPLYKEHLFLPFKDLTTGETTYGAGRYLDLKISDITDNKVVIDFNKCYLPYCAFSAGYNCPIPPSENFLELAVNAGIKMFDKKH
jgi:uncharacterized protein